MNPLDQAIANASALEATYTASTNNVASIQTGIATATAAAQTSVANATAPLAPAQAQLATDTTNYAAGLQALSAAALAVAAGLAPATS